MLSRTKLEFAKAVKTNAPRLDEAMSIISLPLNLVYRAHAKESERSKFFDEVSRVIISSLTRIFFRSKCPTVSSNIESLLLV